MPWEKERAEGSTPARARYGGIEGASVARDVAGSNGAGAGEAPGGDGRLDRLRAALDAERRLARRYEKALECACDARLIAAWRAGLGDARRRAALFARPLGGAAARRIAAVPEPATDCLVEAMALALRNGDVEAAQAVARECVALAESECAAVREGLVGRDASASAGSS